MTGKRRPLVTVTMASLVDCFRDGLIALIPIAERSGIVWRGDDVYDPWENIESTLYDSLVRNYVWNAAPEKMESLPRYGGIHATSNDSEFSFLTERSVMRNGPTWHLYSLLTVDAPFDHAEFIQPDRACQSDPYETVIKRYDQCEWVLNARIGDELRALTEFSC